MSEWIDVAQAGEIEDGGCRVVDVDDIMVAVFHYQGEYYAIEDTWTHDGGELASGELDGCEVICPRHGARFCIKDGEALTPPAYEDVDTYATRVHEGMIQVSAEPG